MDEIAATESLDIAAPRARVYALAAGGEQAPAIFRKTGLLPGVASIEGHRAPWGVAGEQRRLTLTDGGTLTEDLIFAEPGARFVYRASRFSGVFGRLATQARGEFRFEDTSEGTRATWVYVFTPASASARVFVRFIARRLWPGYMRSALSRLKELAEGPS